MRGTRGKGSTRTSKTMLDESRKPSVRDSRVLTNRKGKAAVYFTLPLKTKHWTAK